MARKGDSSSSAVGGGGNGGISLGFDVGGFNIGAPVDNLLTIGGIPEPFPILRASTISRMKVNVTVNSLTNAMTFTVEKGGVPTPVVITVPTGLTGVFSATGTQAFAVDELFAIHVVSASPGGAIRGNCAFLLE